MKTLLAELADEVEALVLERLETGDPALLLSKLTPRQRDIASMMVAGRTVPEIAEALKLSVKTVYAHRSQIHRVLGVKRVTSVIKILVAAGNHSR